MEGRKLNLNAPFLSVRRGSPAKRSIYENNASKKIETSMPNRQRSLASHTSDWSLDQVTKPVAVPFVWEQIPGRPKDDSGLEPHAREEASITPRVPPGRISDRVKYHQPPEENFEENNAAKLQIVLCSSNVGGSNMEEEEDDYSDVYSDALGALYSTNSSSMSCSVSGLSGEDYVTPSSGTFSTDPQTRDFMMSRFLPAAKAMALDSPNYASKKQLVVVERQQPRETKSIATQCKRIPVNQYEYGIIVPYNRTNVVDEGTDTETESEEEDDRYENNADISKKGCGLLPRLGCLLNPVPGLKVQVQTHFSSSSTRGHGETSTESQLRTVKKLNRGYNRPITNSIDQLPTSRSSSPSKRSGCISPYRNVASRSPFRGVGFLGTPRGGESNDGKRPNKEFKKGISKSHELLFPRSTRQSSRSTSPVVEKTLYVDTVKFRDVSSSPIRSTNEDSERINVKEDVYAVESYTRNVNGSRITKNGCVSVTMDTNCGSGSTTYDRLDRDLDDRCKSLGRIKVTSDKSLNTNNNDTTLKSDDVGKVSSGTQLSLLPPPLPKTPTESWLLRAMPTATARNSFSKSYLNSRFVPKTQDQHYSPSSKSKWETIVKTSYLHHDHVRYSEELLTNVTHQSKP